MIKVNLVGASRKKAAKTSGVKFSSPSASSGMPAIVPWLIILASIGGGYLWYRTLASQSEDLSSKIAQAEVQRAQLEAVIRQDQIYETRKRALENRIRVIEGLKRNQVSPVISLDILAEAIDRTQFVWLQSLDQNNTTFTMSGTATSVNAIADFVTNLENTRHFRNVNLANAQDTGGNFSFNLSCEFFPPSAQAAAMRTAPPTGGN